MMFYLKKYINLHLNFAVFVYTRFALKFNNSQYVALINILAFIQNTGVKFYYDVATKEFSYKDSKYGERIYFSHKTRAQMYLKGIRYRAQALGNEYLLNQIPFENGDVVMDCGANIGELYYWFKFNNKKIKYISFEPSPLEFEALRRNCTKGINHNIGLWNTESNLQFYIASEAADSSIIQPASFDDVIQIETKMLENFVTKPIKLLKLEAEGAELEILEGLGEKLALIEYISADLSFERGVDSQSTLVPVINFLLRNNFSLIAIEYRSVKALFRNNNVKPVRKRLC